MTPVHFRRRCAFLWYPLAVLGIAIEGVGTVITAPYSINGATLLGVLIAGLAIVIVTWDHRLTYQSLDVARSG